MSEKRTRELVRKRSTLIYEMMMPTWIDTVNPVCEFCGKRSLDEMHHRKYRSQGGAWCPSNIIGLCWQCHKQATLYPQWAYKLGLSVAGSDEPGEVPVAVWYNEQVVFLDLHGGYRTAS
jgi:5-methylcytosine-specific restriction endonuclease McrA